MRKFVFAFAVVVAAGLVTSRAEAQVVSGAPTFTKDVAPIFYKNCVVCHRPGEVAPFSLVTYESTRPWAKAVKQKVVAREMPPWFADPQYGKFKNDRRLSQAEVDTIAKWVDAGAPKGDDKDMPAMPKLAAGWTYGEPDMIIEMPVEYQLPAEGEIPNFTLYTPFGFSDERFAQAVQMLPTNMAVVHHASTGIVTFPPEAKLVDGKAFMPDGKPARSRGLDADNPVNEGASKLVSYVPGRGAERYPDGTAKRIPGGWFLSFGMHYQATGKPETDRSRQGLWFAKGPVTHEILNGSLHRERYIVAGKEYVPASEGGGDGDESRIVIPPIAPDDDNWRISSIQPFPEAATLYALSPHMHLRGKSMTYVLTYPDGRDETIMSVPKYDFNWQLYYELEKPIHIPAGSKLVAIGTYDNSLKNPYNPAPEKEVFWSEQSWDEMFGPQIRITIDSQDLTKGLGTRRTQQQQQQ